MVLEQFLQFDYKDRLMCTKQATYLGSRNDAAHYIFLYQLDGFYIEVYVCKRYVFINRFHAFDDPDLLEPYFQGMDVLCLT